MEKKYIKVKVETESRKEEVFEIKPDNFNIKVKEKAENNLANRRVLEILKGSFFKNAKNLKIVSGHKKPSKILLAEYW